MELLKTGTARMSSDGIMDTRYSLTNKVETELFTMITVDLLYEDEIDQLVSIYLCWEKLKNIIRLTY